MEKEKKMKIIRTFGIIAVLVLFSFVLRAQTYTTMEAQSPDIKAMYVDSDGLPYFTEMDSYYHLRLLENLNDNGHLGDTVINNTQWDEHRNSPDGKSAEYTPMIFYVTLFFYKILSLIFHNLPIKFVAYWTGAILGSLVVVPAFLTVKRITNTYGGIVAALLIAMGPNFFAHSYAGFFDTDMFTTLLPLIMLFFFVESILNKNPKHRLISAVLMGLTVAVSALSWDRYVFYPAIFTFAIVLFLIIGLIFRINLFKPMKNYSNIKSWFIDQKEISTISIFLVVSFIGLIAVLGFNGLMEDISGLFGALNLQSVATSLGDYPNVMISVSEMQKPQIVVGGLLGLFSSNSGGLINGVGGVVVFLTSLFMVFVFIYNFWKLRNINSKDLKGKKLPKSKRRSNTNLKSTQNESFINKFSNLILSTDADYDKRVMILFFTIFGAWLLVSLIASLMGSRFIPFFVIPAALTSGMFVGYFFDYIKKYDNDRTRLYLAIASSLLISYSSLMIFPELGWFIPLVVLSLLLLLTYALLYNHEAVLNAVRKIKGLNTANIRKSSFIIILICLAVVAPSITSAYYSSTHSGPQTSTNMWNSMESIKATQPVDTVIASWWDYGYLFEIAADRQTVFDGGLQSGERAYWIGKSITTSDDKLSSAILKMLATTGDKAADTLTNYTNSKGKAAKILEEILTKSKADAKNVLTSNYNLTSNQADTVVNYSHPDNPRPVIFVMSSDMIDKIQWCSYFGSWDFETQQSKMLRYFAQSKPTSSISQNGTANVTEMINYQQGQGNNSLVYKTVLTKYSNGSTDVKFVASHDDGTPILLPDGSEFKPQFNSKNVIIHDAVVVEDGKLTANKTLNESGAYALAIVGDGGNYQSVLMDKDLLGSMFTKLYLMNGASQSSFENVGKYTGVSLWKVK
ncbi:MAG: dolichyl-diphosphooligosaccharide--protein glycosyltransferase subunit STT3 [Methanobrevibacter sp.]|jgi:dolichyl-diphosphooligosaccharide--protein glycosyltransferase|nr:dolichyl-diphosphooligosaccharide--protein glycosyltransferase subunit STT3 [Candidatus Methanovirga australis]